MTFFRFISDEYPEHERNAALEELYAPVCGMDIDIARADISVDVRGQVLPRIAFAESTLSNHTASRSYSHIVDGDDAIVLIIPQSGALALTHRRRGQQACIPGQVHLAPADSPFVSSNTGQLQVTSISLPAVWVESHLGQLLLQQTIDVVDRGALSLLLVYLRNLIQVGTNLSPGARQLSELHLLDLVALALGADRDSMHLAKGRGEEQVRLQLVREFVRANMKSSALCPEDVARHFGISPQSLKKLFQDSGTNFADYLVGVRLDWVYDSLVNPVRPRQNISTLAYHVGFNNLAWFNRAFKRRFGVVPSEVSRVEAPAS